VSLLDLGVGVELRSCFSSAFWVCVSGCDEAAIIEFFVAGSDESAVDKSEDEPGTVIEPCNVFVVDTALVGPVLRAPEEIGWPVIFTGALEPGVLELTLVTRETIEEHTLATVVKGWLNTLAELPWKGKFPVDTASAAARFALTVEAAADVRDGIVGGPRVAPSPLFLDG